MAEPFTGEIRMVAFNFAPNGWAFCDGQLMSIEQNPALFSLLGTIYGGNGQTTFALPDFRSRGPIHRGQGNGLSDREFGEVGGAETTVLSVAGAEIPQQPDRPQVLRYVPGNGQPFSIMQPFLVVGFIISLNGAYPQRPPQGSTVE